jgi:tol-pal system protein YbgF
MMGIMKIKSYLSYSFLCAAGLLFAQTLLAADKGSFKHLSIEQRVHQLELAQENEQSLQLPRKMDLLLEEVQSLRDKVEDLEHRFSDPDSDKVNPLDAKDEAPVETLKSVDREKSSEQYEAAYALLQERKYPEALTAFQAFVQEDHEPRLRGNAWYWIGEVYLLQRNKKMAAEAFSRVVRDYPENNKVADSLLKLGYIAYDQKEYIDAKKWLEKVNKEFPDTASARLADVRLQRLQQEGH